MTRRSAATVVLVAAAGMAVAAAPAAQAAGWRTVPTAWSGTAVSVQDVWSVGDRSWAVGTETFAGGQRAVVQDCTGATCTRVVLPDPAGALPGTAAARSVSGTSATDVWVVGGAAESDAQLGVAWHWDGASWTVQEAIAPNTSLGHVVAVSPTESYALGDYDYGDGGTSVILHRVGATWTNLTPPESAYLPGACASWYYNQFSDLAVVGGAPVVVGECDGGPVVLKGSGATTWRRLDAGLPAGARFRQAAAVGGQLWVQGTAANGDLLVYRRPAGAWQAVPTTGVAAGATIADLAGKTATSVWMVGSRAGVATTWRLAGGSWSEVPVPAAVAGARLTSVWVAGPTSTYAAGQDAARPAGRQGVLLRAG